MFLRVRLTATVAIWSCRQVRMTLQAISPLFAMRILLNGRGRADSSSGGDR